LIRVGLVFLGGGAGAVVRYIAGIAIMQRFGGLFPLGTFAINVTGSFLIGVLMTLFTQRLDLSPNWRFLLVIGFLGGYTTFSSFEYETIQAVRQGALGMGILNVAASVLAGYLAVWLGIVLTARG
jgi:CrcB protein